MMQMLRGLVLDQFKTKYQILLQKHIKQKQKITNLSILKTELCQLQVMSKLMCALLV